MARLPPQAPQIESLWKADKLARKAIALDGHGPIDTVRMMQQVKAMAQADKHCLEDRAALVSAQEGGLRRIDRARLHPWLSQPESGESEHLIKLVE